MAALLLQCTPQVLAGTPGAQAPGTARANLASALEGGAAALGSPLPNNTFGWGRLSATGAAPLANCKDTDGDGWPDGMEIAAGKDPNVYCATMRADLNLDGVVDGLDLTLFAANFGMSVPPADARDDQNHDGSIDLLDLTLFAGEFGVSTSGCP